MSAVATRTDHRAATVRAPTVRGTPCEPIPDVVSRPRSRWWARALWAVGLVVAVITVRAALPDLRAGVASLGEAHVGMLAAAVTAQILALATLPLTFRAALALMGGSVGYRTALNGALGAFALSRVVPGGGLAGALYAARRFARAGNTAFASGAGVAVAGVVTMLTLALIVVTGALAEAVAGRGTTGLIGAVGGGVAVLVGGTVILGRALADPGRVDAWCARLARTLRRPDEAPRWRAHVDMVAVALAQPRRLAVIGGWAVVNWALQLLALWTVFAALGVTMPAGVLVLGFGAANLVTALPHTPGGLGVVEAGMTATYVAMGVALPTALVGVLCYRLIGHWFPVLAALPLALPTGERGGARP